MNKQYAIVETLYNFKLANFAPTNDTRVYKIFTNRKEAEKYLKEVIDDKIEYYEEIYPDIEIKKRTFLSIIPDISCTIYNEELNINNIENKIGFNKFEIVEVKEYNWRSKNER